jgi:hypothetical protein
MFWSNKQKPNPDTVYLGESTRQDGSKQVYTGMTRRPVCDEVKVAKKQSEVVLVRGGPVLIRPNPEPFVAIDHLVVGNVGIRISVISGSFKSLFLRGEGRIDPPTSRPRWKIY